MIFADRHIGSGPDESAMLAVVGAASLEDLLRRAVPPTIHEDSVPHGLPGPASEPEVLQELARMAALNRVSTPMIGQGYYDTATPEVIRRNVLENPAWYTAYTPYQPEISQGRLEALLNFQTMVADLTGLPVAGASMLDEATAVAEAMLLARRAARTRGNTLLVDRDIFAQTRAVLETRAAAVDVALVDLEVDGPLPGLDDVFGVVLQVPGASGRIPERAEIAAVVEAAHAAGALVIIVADLLAACLICPPGDLGADIAAGTTQRFGVPLGFGGPHAGYLAVSQGLVRQLPGRLVGVSRDADGAPAYRLALQTREQHIRREKATSNICTAQVLLAVMASMYAVWHGPEGLRDIARGVHERTLALSTGLAARNVAVLNRTFFDTLTVRVDDADAALRDLRERNITVWRQDDTTVRVSVDECTTAATVEAVIDVLGGHASAHVSPVTAEGIPGAMRRESGYLTHPVFHRYHTETAMMRYLRRLADRDYALDRGMIPLGSCTMKLNSAVSMAPITWPGFARIHPFAPAGDVAGYRELIDQLTAWLLAVTGYDAASLQPNAGSQGELSGLLAIRAYHRARGEGGRTVCLIPSSAHGTNAASAVLAGLRVVVVACDAAGNIDLDDLRRLVDEHRDRLAAIMITYPSTHGVYEESVTEVCDLVHSAGGQVYIDGANLNALVGVARPGKFGGDVSHLNLHKTFAIPHGGGGPGVGPVVARAHLAPFLPGHPLDPFGGRADGAVSAAPHGSASILPISWAYIRLLGAEGLRRATGAAVLAANYVAARLAGSYPILYRGPDGLVAHECILDLRELRSRTGVTVDDVAKRLIDYGFHAPTMSFPVAGTLMVEPTESEDLTELDRFCDAMTAIAREAEQVAQGRWPADDNPLTGAPHTARCIAGDWPHPYPRSLAVFPGGSADKYWPPVRRIDGAWGDRHLVCACPPPDAFAGEAGGE